ncbi:MAG: RNA polymerase sigma factor [Terriglobales bacterium]
MTQHALVSGVALMAGTNEDALETAVREHARLVYSIAYSVLRNHHDAEDATQETFVRVLRYKRKLEGIEDPKTWLARIAWRVAIQRGKRRPVISMSEIEVHDAAKQIRSQLASAEENALGKELSALLASLISALPETLRDVLRLSTVEGFSPAEIAQVLGSTESSVRSRIFRARQILKEKLGTLEGNCESTR